MVTWKTGTSHYVRSDLPDLCLKELHVSIQEGVRGRKNADWLHSCPSLRLTHHRHVGKTCQAVQFALPEIPVHQQGYCQSYSSIVALSKNRYTCTAHNSQCNNSDSIEIVFWPTEHVTGFLQYFKYGIQPNVNRQQLFPSQKHCIKQTIIVNKGWSAIKVLANNIYPGLNALTASCIYRCVSC